MMRVELRGEFESANGALTNTAEVKNAVALDCICDLGITIR
jgi:hypothetical protein